MSLTLIALALFIALVAVLIYAARAGRRTPAGDPAAALEEAHRFERLIREIMERAQLEARALTQREQERLARLRAQHAMALRVYDRAVRERKGDAS